jgi:hypothetical protein
MLWFFGALSLLAFLCTLALWINDQRKPAPLPA